MTTYRVIKPYQSSYLDPIILKEGVVLTTSTRETDWPGWIWCTTASGESRWVPDTYLEQFSGQTVMRCDYNPLELTVHIDELLTAFAHINGWAWCVNLNHQQGWVPLECLLEA